ncbi:MAG: hypothetical protein K9L21_05005 [Spirochaetia bacterium]|nr:hypothetical protein [Spirochaetia bacterium]
MMKKHMSQRITKRIRWSARILSIPIILYAVIVAVGYFWSWLSTGTADPYAVEQVTIMEFLPLISLSIGIIGLGIAWRRELLGGMISIFALLTAVVLLLFVSPITADFPRSGIPYLLVFAAAVPGLLFLISRHRTAVEQE